MTSKAGNNHRASPCSARTIIGLVALPLAFGISAGCTPEGTETVRILVEEPATTRVVLGSAERIRLANALSWKQGMSGDAALRTIDKISDKHSGDREARDKALAPYRKMEREHARFLRQQRLDAIRARSGGGNGTGGNSGNSGGHTH